VMMNNKAAILSLLIFYSVTALGQKNVIGCYRNNFAELGFFGTRISLNTDSTFQYRFAGDLQSDYGSGKYHLIKDTIFLRFDKDSSKYNRPTRFLYHHNKLFSFNIETGKVVKYAQGYSKHKEYLFFGSHYRIMRHYLKRLPCEDFK
jgi:hypothetical protein